VISVAEQLATTIGRRLSLSLGGSALLPILSKLPKSSLPVQLRIGEAILTGTIPGASGDAIGLRPPFTLAARVVEVTRLAPTTLRINRILIDQGSTALHLPDARLHRETPGEFIHASAEMSVVQVPATSSQPQLGDTVLIHLGFESALRALSRPPLPTSFIGAERLSTRAGMSP